MIARWPVHIGVVAVTAAILFAFSPVEVKSQRNTAGRVTVGAGDLGGVVTSTKGPEAGVWVIAETTDLPTKLAKIVVTDDQGRYLIPDLPKANYNVWVRGYGLVDSPKVSTALGKTLDLKAVPAPTPAQAAEYYPALYWFSLLRVPEKSEFPLQKIKSQGEWLNIVKTGACQSCHALDSERTRHISEFRGSVEAPASVGRRAGPHDSRYHEARHRNRAEIFRRLDRPYCTRRVAFCETRTASRN